MNMNWLTRESGILNKAVDAINLETGLQLHITKREARQADAIAMINIPEADACLVAEVKRCANHVNVGAIINQLKQIAAPDKGVLVADYINSKRGQRLKEANVQYMDTVGNAYINQPPVYIYINGNKLKVDYNQRKTITGKAFQPTGMKIIFAFLTNRELINASYREIAGQAQVALGTVGWVIRDLVAQGILLEGAEKHQRRLAAPDQLLAKWVEAYPHRLREKFKMGLFTTDDAEWWKDVNSADFNAQWGGEIAAAKYTDYLNPKHALIYINREHMAKFLQAARLRQPEPHEQPDICIDLIEPFWKDALYQEKQEGLVHPIIAYADLIETGEARNLEAANLIREKYLR